MLSINKTGMAVSAFAALGHLVWALLVWFGWAQGLANCFFNMHFVEPVYTISYLDFNFLTAIWLVIVAAIFAYLIGAIFAVLWNIYNKI